MALPDELVGLEVRKDFGKGEPEFFSGIVKSYSRATRCAPLAACAPHAPAPGSAPQRRRARPRGPAAPAAPAAAAAG